MPIKRKTFGYHFMSGEPVPGMSGTMSAEDELEQMNDALKTVDAWL